MNLSDAPLSLSHAVIGWLSLRRPCGSWAHCLPDGRWVESFQPADQNGKASHCTPIPDGPELRRLIAYSTGFECLGFFETLSTGVAGADFKTLGTRAIAYPANRGFGSFSCRSVTLDGTTRLTSGHREVEITASQRKPIECRSIASVVCGRRVATGYVPEGFNR